MKQAQQTPANTQSIPSRRVLSHNKCNDHMLYTLYQSEAAAEKLDNMGITMMQITVCGARPVIHVANGPELQQLRGAFFMRRAIGADGVWASDHAVEFEGCLLIWSIRGN